MAIPKGFLIPGFGQVVADMVADFQNRFPQANVSRLSGHWKRLAVVAGGIAALHRHLQVIARDLLPDTAAAPMLDRHGAIYGAIRKPATGAEKDKALRLTGEPGSAFVAGTQLTTTDGLTFAINETGVLPASGFRDVYVKAVSVGAATRKSAGTVMTFSTTLPGINGTAVLQLDIDQGGVDQEQDGPYRVRVLDAIAEPNEGGAANDFRQWAKELPGIAEAYVWPLRGGLGSVHVAALKTGTGAARTLTGGEQLTLKAYLDGKRPVGYRDVFVLSTVPEPNDVEMLITPADELEFDWVDSTPLIVAGWNPATRTLKFTTPRPPDMDVGDRLVYVRNALPQNSGKEMVIEGFGAADEVILRADDELITSPPFSSVTNLVYSGGPLVAPVRDAVVAHMNQLGPGRADSVDTTKNYSSGSNWEGTLRRSKLHGLASQQAGIVDVEIPTPAANVSPTNAAPALTVGYVVPRQVLVRRKW